MSMRERPSVSGTDRLGPVATGLLRFVQRAIRPFDEFGEARRAFATAKARRTEAGGDPHRRIAKRERLCRQLGARAVDDRRQIRFVGMRDDVEEFLAADPPRDVRRPGIAFQDLAKRFEHDVARVMAVRVVDLLEVIEVDHHHPEREAVTDRRGQLVRRPGFDGASVGQSSQRIGQREMLEQLVLFLQLTMQID